MNANKRIHNAIAAVAPIDGVSAKDPDDKATWVIQFQDSATKGQIAAAKAVLDRFDPNAVPPEPSKDERLAKLLSVANLTIDDLKQALAEK